MKEKSGFFSFFRGISSRTDYNSEEEKQREYARNQEQGLETDQVVYEEEPYTPDENVIPISQEAVDFCVSTLSNLLNECTFESEVTITKKEGDKLFLEIVNTEDVGRIIGREGQTLESLQTLVRAIAYKKFAAPVKVILDAGDYREKRTSSLKSIALRAARSVMQRNSKIELKPMNAAERRIIHVMFKNHRNVRSFSVGEGNDRHIVLECKNGNAEQL